LAFHPYPQLIPSVFNLSGFGPPRGLTRASPWPWVDHPASGPQHATTPPQHGGYALFRLAFAAATPPGLTSRRAGDSQAHSSKGTPSPHQPGGFDGLWAHGFRYSFTPLPGYFSPFPHGTHPLSVIGTYLGLPGGPGRFTADSTGPLLLGTRHRQARDFHVPGSHRLRQTIPGHFR
jgi:hypothetical protein